MAMVPVHPGESWSGVGALGLWVAKFEDKERMDAATCTFRGLFPILEAEQARRLQAARYTKNCGA
ncbi:hypothetical protein N7519_002219 [Penicillium mononematosum]|uniref:uncharacterized protein n=1 Tax=Penicillium mononematosum TaxID=268346 RepID=UPI0025488FFE|nr:uncharacterized protein N7519_002219 [Penicillium mononematosum]KAJ6187311.1 hypothetical protein N7519_002219 [Penicillium mononematosum]